MIKISFFLTVLFCFVTSFPQVGIPQRLNKKTYTKKNDLFRQELRRLVTVRLKKRDGIILFKDIKTHELEIFGNAKLFEQEFLPGSLAKLLSAELAIKTNQTLSFDCSGHVRLKNRQKYYCWNYHGHGKLDLSKAISVSCNLYFLSLAENLNYSDWKNLLQSYQAFKNKDFILSLREKSSLLWSVGESLSIKWSPQEALAFWEELMVRLQYTEYSEILTGLKWVAQKGGTAQILSESGLAVLAKTGTVESSTRAYPKDAWLLVAYPYERPRFLIVIFLKRARAYQDASLLAKEILILAKEYHENF